jgi:hypothetical protein
LPAQVSWLGDATVRTGRRVDERPTMKKNLQFADYADDVAHYVGLPRYVHHGYGLSAFSQLGNDTYGDCTCAAFGHQTHVWNLRDGGGKGAEPTLKDVLALYWATGDPPGQGKDDNGRYPRDILDYLMAHPGTFPSLPAPLAYVQIDPSNSKHVRTAIYLFGGVYAGLGLPVAAQTMATWEISSSTKLTGDYEVASWGGHMINLMAYDQARVEYGGVTWGARIGVGQSFLHAYCDEMYAVLGPSWIDAESPAGFDLAALQADLAKLKAA